MKNKIFVLLFLSLFFIKCSCKKDTLTNTTQTGANTFAMLVNGELWNMPPCVFCPPIVQLLDKGLLQVHGLNGNERLYFYVNTHYLIGNYQINKMWYTKNQIQDSCSFFTRFTENNNCYSYRLIDSTKSGVSITRLDTINRIVSGTFYMTLSNFQGGQLNITEGRFDGKY